VSRRIRVAKDKEDIMRSLAGTGPENASDGVFDSMAEAVLFAAFLGYSQEHRLSIEEYSRKIDPIRPEYIPHSGIEFIGLLSFESIDVLGNDTEVDIAQEFEEYANAGLEIIVSMLGPARMSSMRVNALIASLNENGRGGTGLLDTSSCIY
jgi:dnd system-associated protein 4